MEDVNKQRLTFIFLSILGYGRRNSISGGFAYIWQSKWVGIIAIKTGKTQILFLRDVLVAVASLDLKAPNLIGDTNGKKAIGLYQQNKTIARASRARTNNFVSATQAKKKLTLSMGVPTSTIPSLVVEGEVTTVAPSHCPLFSSSADWPVEIFKHFNHFFFKKTCLRINCNWW